MGPKDQTPKLEQQLDDLSADAHDLADDISETFDMGQTLETDSSQLSTFEARLSRLDDCYDKFRSASTRACKLARTLNNAEEIQNLEQLKIKTRDKYYKSLATGHKFIKANTSVASMDTNLNHSLIECTSHIRLPTINLPSFNGAVSDWISFKDTFSSLIHTNSGLTNVQKYHYLKSALKGSAAQTVSSIPITEAAYTQAWETLCKRYDNKRLQASNYLIKIFNFKPLNKPNSGLEQFVEVILECALAFKNLKLEDPDGFILYTFALRLLDPSTREKFEMECASLTEVPDFNFFSNFIHRQLLHLQSTNLIADTSPPNRSPIKGSTKASKQIFMSTEFNNRNNICPMCQDRHRIYHCTKFLKLTPSERFKEAKRRSLCVNCLIPSHKTSKCSSAKTCHKCEQSHHTLLHFVQSRPYKTDDFGPPKEIKETGNTAAQENSQAKSANAFYSSANGEHANTLLATACARIQDISGNYQLVRMVIDSGAQRSFITADCARRLGLPWSRNPHCLKGFADTPINGGKYQIKCALVPKDKAYPELNTNAVVISSISKRLPSAPLPTEILRFYSEQELSDPLFYKPGPVDFLLGADLFGEIFTGERLDLPYNIPRAFQTIFGCIVLGPVNYPTINASIQDVSLVAFEEDSETSSFEKTMQRFWQVEEVAATTHQDPLDVKCEEHFRKTHFRDETGRYGVRLPFKDSLIDLGDSYQTALHRFQRLEFKLSRNWQMKQEYEALIHEHIDLGYVTPAQDRGKYFLPHHGVVKDSSSTRLRIVFDASSQTSTGSLNNQLLAGPKLQLDIRDVLLQFRRYPIALTADICQMYLQILVHPEDRAYQHFLYRFDSSEVVNEYELTRVTFGLSCSPFLALRVIQQLIEDEGSDYPLASEALRNNIYIDDILTGADTVEEAHQLQKELIALLAKGGFKLKKWASNSTYLLNNLPEECRESSVSLSNLEESSIKILGMQWDANLDQLSYKVQLTKFTPTKRGVLSAIARMYDPLGYLSPIIFKAKVIMQNLWKSKLNWDDPLHGNLLEDWKMFFDDLYSIGSIRIPRCVSPTPVQSISLIGFADASSLGYAAVFYIKTKDSSGFIQTHLIYSKTRLAPLKTLTIPRLELCAAHLLIQTLKNLQTFLKSFPILTVYLITDSSIVLAWLRTPPYKLRTFVANRVVAILEHSSAEQWYHVKSEDNIADLASRGISPSCLLEHQTWWKGPSWLHEERPNWPISQDLNPTRLPELKSECSTVLAASCEMNINEVIQKFSSWGKLIRVISYIKRFASNCSRRPSERQIGHLTLKELNESNFLIIRATQTSCFSGESLLKNPSLQRLSPFYDSRGILRVGGRLANSPLKEDEKHPILLPRNAHFTKIMIDHYHRSYLHAGPQLLQSLLNRRYWIVSGRSVIRSRIHKCFDCHRLRVKTYQPYMSDLPTSRFAQGRPFINTGIDFAGPFITKESKRKRAIQHKSYTCIFICLSTKAIHLELVSDLTTAAFLSSLDRFIGRRGLPAKIMSDHGTNFVGAARTLQELYLWFNSNSVQSAIIEHLGSRQIEWVFIPPAAPHFGGIWEAGVKSFKYHLTRILKNQVFTFEEFNTLLIRIEAVLNSRPLHPISTSPDDFDTLTPGHFLIGGPLLAVPEHDYSSDPSNRLTRWQLISKCIQDVWKRWRLDYLNTLQAREKWRVPNPNIECGTLVLIKEPNSPILSWPTGRVIEVFPGPDGVVRVVKLKTAKGEYLRPVVKLAPLLPPNE